MSIEKSMRKSVALLSALSIGLFAASEFPVRAQRQSEDTKPSRKTLPAPTNSERFFTECSPDSTGKHDCAVIERIYSSRLRQLGETPLLSVEDSRPSDIYRIAVVHPVSTAPARIARIQLGNDGSITLTAIISDQNGNIASSRKTILTGQKSEHLRAMLSWDVFSSIDSLNNVSAGLPVRPVADEGYYFLEGLHGESYHVLHRSLGKADQFSIGIYRYLEELGLWSGMSP